MPNGTPALLDALKALLYPMVKEAVAEALREQKSQELPAYPEKVGIAQASEITGFTKNSLYQMHAKGLIPGAVKIGGKLLFDTKALLLWVESGGKKQTMGNLAPNDRQNNKPENGLPEWPRHYDA